MQIYTQNPNHTRKNMIFFKKVNKSTGLRVNEFLGSLKGLFWVCFGSVKKIHPNFATSIFKRRKK